MTVPNFCYQELAFHVPITFLRSEFEVQRHTLNKKRGL